MQQTPSTCVTTCLMVYSGRWPRRSSRMQSTRWSAVVGRICHIAKWKVFRGDHSEYGRRSEQVSFIVECTHDSLIDSFRRRSSSSVRPLTCIPGIDFPGSLFFKIFPITLLLSVAWKKVAFPANLILHILGFCRWAGLTIFDGIEIDTWGTGGNNDSTSSILRVRCRDR